MTKIVDLHNGQADRRAFEAEENYWARTRQGMPRRMFGEPREVANVSFLEESRDRPTLRELAEERARALAHRVYEGPAFINGVPGPLWQQSVLERRTEEQRSEGRVKRLLDIERERASELWSAQLRAKVEASRAADAERKRVCGHWDPEGAWEP